MRTLLALSIMLIAIGGCSGLPMSDTALEAFETRAEACAHWSGEDAYDAARGAQIAKALRSGRCDFLLTDAERLRAANRSNPAAVVRIDTAVSPFY